MAGNDWFLQFLADILDLPVARPATLETTALGAAFLAGLQIGFYRSLEDISERWTCARTFDPALEAASRERLYAGWCDAVRRVRSFDE